MRHCRLIRIEYCPSLLPRRASKRLLGKALNASRDGAALSIESRFVACFSNPWNAATNHPLANNSVRLSRYPRIIAETSLRANDGGRQASFYACEVTHLIRATNGMMHPYTHPASSPSSPLSPSITRLAQFRSSTSKSMAQCAHSYSPTRTDAPHSVQDSPS